MAGMRRYLASRIIQTFITLFAILTITFFLFEALPARADDLLAQSPLIDEAQKQFLRDLYGFDLPVEERYVKFLWNMFTFDFGQSISFNRPVMDLLAERVPRTLLLFGLATIVAYIVGAIIGTYIAWRRGGAADGTSVVASLVFYNMPSFWLGLILLFFFGYILGWFPLAGYTDPSSDVYKIHPFLDVLWHLFLPLITLVLLTLAGTTLLMRTSMLDVIGENYVLTAIAKGLKERTVMFKHAARNASLPLVTSFVIAMAFSIGGAVVLEQVFSFPGVGFLYINALFQLDFPLALATLYIISLIVLIGNLGADIMYGYLDPRIRVEATG
jgi:peptide/nickel transport system permease protein